MSPNNAENGSQARGLRPTRWVTIPPDSPFAPFLSEIGGLTFQVSGPVADLEWLQERQRFLEEWFERHCPNEGEHPENPPT